MFQIVILIIGIIALGYSVGQSFGGVDAVEKATPKTRCTDNRALMGCPFGYECMGNGECWKITDEKNVKVTGGKILDLNDSDDEKEFRSTYYLLTDGIKNDFKNDPSQFKQIYLDYPGVVDDLKSAYPNSEKIWGPQVEKDYPGSGYIYDGSSKDGEEQNTQTEEEKAQEVVNKYDTDRDNEISEDELEKVPLEDKVTLQNAMKVLGIYESVEKIWKKVFKEKEDPSQQQTQKSTNSQRANANVNDQGGGDDEDDDGNGDDETEEEETTETLKYDEFDRGEKEELDKGEIVKKKGKYYKKTDGGEIVETNKEGEPIKKGDDDKEEDEEEDEESDEPERSSGITQKIIDKLGGGGAAKAFGSLISYAGHAAAARLLVGQAINFLGVGNRNARNIKEAGWIIAAGVTTVAMTDVAIGKKSFMQFGQGKVTSAGGPKGWVVGLWALGATAAYIGATYQNYAQEEFTYTPQAWQPPVGGDECEKCNELEFGCNQYQCHSFGQACKLINENTPDARCIEDNEGDSKPPIISPLNDSLPTGFSYSPLNVGLGDSGVKIIGDQENGCIPPFTALTLGVQTSEAAKCKIGITREKSYDNMSESYMSGGGMNIINHTLYVPSSVTPSEKYLEELGINSELPEMKKGDEYNYYIRCQDTHGNENPRAFVVNFCVADKDLSPPEIKGFENIVSGEAVSYGTRSLGTEVYLNEPATCKWDHQDVNYEQMANEMTNCDTEVKNMGGAYYTCTANFTGIKDRTENKYYIKCKDNPEADAKNRNTNKKSEVLTISGSQPIQITSLEINGQAIGSTIRDSRNEIPIEIRVKTAEGVDNGKTRCQYQYGGANYYFNMDYSTTNIQKMWLTEGIYNIPITCTDKAGNSQTANAIFTIEIDENSPLVIRAYNSEDSLNIETDEGARCFYDTKDCDYETEEGTMLESSSDRKQHRVSWDTEQTLYIKCEDQYGNKPNPDECTLEVSPYEV